MLLQDHNATSSSNRRAKEAGSDAQAMAREVDTAIPALQHQHQHQHQHRTARLGQRSQWPVGGVVARTWRGTALMW